MTRERAPGMALLHPFAVLSLLVLVVNDHWLKHAHPGWLSGKLSDFAAVLLLPLFLHASFELGQRALAAPAMPLASRRASNRALAASLAFTCLVYAPPELWPPAELAYRYAFGALQWPFRLLWSLAQGAPAAAFAPVRATADPSDLMALVMLWVAWRIAQRGPRVRASRLASAALLALLTLGAPRAVLAAGRSQPRTHDGFYASFEVGPELFLLHSAASVSNGFEQPIASSAIGLGLPSGALELGGTFRGTGLVIGATVAKSQVRDPVVSTLGTRFELQNATLSAIRFGAFARYYPDPNAGLSLGLGGGPMSLELEASGGQELRGGYLTLEAGHGVWLSDQWTLGLNARLTAAQLHGDISGATRILMPGLYLAIAWH